MHAVRLHAFGPAENLVYERTEDPVPGPGQVRIAVAAAGVHLLDTVLREGERGPYPEPVGLPTVPGREVAGTVESVGGGTDAAWLGKRVVAHIGMAPGGYAELTVTEADRLHEIPEGLDAASAVAMIGTGRTALGILGFTPLGPDSVVVVTAAAGGIGTLVVQYAKNAGATVIALAGGPAKVARARAAARTSPSTTPALTGRARPANTSKRRACGPPSSTTPSAGPPPAPPWTSSAPAGSTWSTAGPARGSTTGGRSPSPTRSRPNAPSRPGPSSDRG